ncbi:MAG: lasso peptide biosynthesis PqqD family chaperone [Thermoclostridium sp.]|nr:lasso peptide biosynthesis PqqD family chaperone [Thermoclostridium sp.]
MTDLKAVIVRNPEIVASDMDGETVMMHIDTGKYYNLGRTGGFIWSLLEEPLEMEALIGKLMEKFQVNREQCEQDTLAFLQKVIGIGLIQVIQEKR